MGELKPIIPVQCWLRISTHDRLQIMNFINRYSPFKYAYCLEEKGDNKHCHILFWRLVKRDTINATLKKMFPKQYAFTKRFGQGYKDLVKVVGYMFKQDPNPVIHNIDPITVQLGKDYNNVIAKAKARRKMRILERIIEDNNFISNPPSPIIALNAVMDDYDERFAAYDQRLIEKQTVTILCRTNERYRKNFKINLRNKILELIS